jgi:hypothetical protein
VTTTNTFYWLHSVISTWRLPEVARWNDDNTTAQDPLRMRITNPVEPNLTTPNLFKTDNKSMAGRKLMKFGVGIVPQLPSTNSYFVTSHTRKLQLDRSQNSRVGIILCACGSLTQLNLTQPNPASSQLIFVCTNFITRKQLDGIYEIWYERYATGDNYKLILLNFLQSVIPTWRVLDVVRWR